jgi:hypothetical protein
MSGAIIGRAVTGGSSLIVHTGWEAPEIQAETLGTVAGKAAS